MSIVFWTLCILTAVLGTGAGALGLQIVASKQDLTGLYLLILTTFLLAAAGVFATLAVKRCQGEKT